VPELALQTLLSPPRPAWSRPATRRHRRGCRPGRRAFSAPGRATRRRAYRRRASRPPPSCAAGRRARHERGDEVPPVPTSAPGRPVLEANADPVARTASLERCEPRRRPGPP
jgi:hypothetical protein